MSKKLLIPLGVFVVLVRRSCWSGSGAIRAKCPRRSSASRRPPFTLAQLHEPAKTLGPADLKGQVWLLNVWASWCVSCRDEHPLLVELAKAKIVPIVGLNYKDKTAAGMRWLAQHGDPYNVSVVDRDGRVGIDWGVYGVPETFVVDKAGVDPLQADRPGHRRSARKEDPAAGPRAAEVMSAHGRMRAAARWRSPPRWRLRRRCRRRRAPDRKGCRRGGARRARSPKSCAASSARTRRSPTPTPSSRRTCAGRFASRSPPARATTRSSPTWSPATAISCSTSRRSRPRRLLLWAGPALLLVDRVRGPRRIWCARGARSPKRRRSPPKNAIAQRSFSTGDGGKDLA